MCALLKIPETISLIKTCWQTAEERIRDAVETKFHEADEEFITKLICGELRSEFKMANLKHRFEAAFKVDLARAYPRSDLTWIAKGLIARVVHHPKKTEALTGGDFGLLVARPQVELRYDTPKITMRSQGLLVQAKKQRSNGDLGSLTPNQRRALPSRLSYIVFVLYMYENLGGRLSPLIWLCPSGIGISDIESNFVALKKKCPKALEDVRKLVAAPILSSMDVLEALAEGYRGTSDQAIIKEDICPENASSVTIEITWPNQKPPDPPHQHLIHRTRVQTRA